jgi:hypothetical protein
MTITLEFRNLKRRIVSLRPALAMEQVQDQPGLYSESYLKKKSERNIRRRRGHP